MGKRSDRLSMIANLALRGLMVYFGSESLRVSLTNRRDRRFAGKAIALRNVLLLGGFSMLIPGLYFRSRRRTAFPWQSDALLLSIPVVDMAGNSFDLYNRYGVFDSFAHFYGNVASGWLLTLAMLGRGRADDMLRVVVAATGTTFCHVLLEVQEYWTDVLFGTRNVEGLEDTEGDILSGLLGAVTGVALAEILSRGRMGARIMDEAQRLACSLDLAAAPMPPPTRIQLTPTPSLHLVDDAVAAVWHPSTEGNDAEGETLAP